MLTSLWSLQTSLVFHISRLISLRENELFVLFKALLFFFSCCLYSNPILLDISSKIPSRNFLGGAVDRNLPASAGKMGSISGLRRFHMLVHDNY